MRLLSRFFPRRRRAASSGKLRSFERRLGYDFTDSDLLRLALTHRSFANEQRLPVQNERLEFLGDAVLGLVTGEELYQRHEAMPEGELSRRKSYLVSEVSLAQMAAELRLGQVLRLGVGEDRSGGRGKPSLLADALEAVLGAVFLDGGLNGARSVLRPLLSERMESTGDWDHRDHKTRLQELLQSDGGSLPRYIKVAEEGPDHAKTFTVECRVNGQVAGTGQGSSKKAAEQSAAAAALDQLARLDPPGGPS
jgi:ribonuclease-3